MPVLFHARLYFRNQDVELAPPQALGLVADNGIARRATIHEALSVGNLVLNIQNRVLLLHCGHFVFPLPLNLVSA
jgi:hypothetical protein